MGRLRRSIRSAGARGGLSLRRPISIFAGASLLVGVGGALTASPAAAKSQLKATTLVSGLSYIDAIAVDSFGNLYISTGSTVEVLPETTGTLFGVSVTADKLSPLPVPGASDIALDSAGDLFLASNSLTGAAVSVLPRSTGTIFGIPVTTGTLATVVEDLPGGLPPNVAQHLAIDPFGNLYVSNINTSVLVLPRTTGTVFGTPVTADEITAIPDATNTHYTFDPSGDFFGFSNFAVTGGPLKKAASGNSVVHDFTVDVLPSATGSLFGVPVTANTPSSLSYPGDEPEGLAFDSAGNLYMSLGSRHKGTILVVPRASGTLFGESFRANTIGTLLSGKKVGGLLALDSSGDLYMATQHTVSVLRSPTSNPLVISTSSFPNGSAGHTYSAALAATGGTPPYKWSLSSGSLPKGLHLKKPTGIISGTPKTTDSGTFTFTVKAVDHKRQDTTTKVLSIRIS